MQTVYEKERRCYAYQYVYMKLERRLQHAPPSKREGTRKNEKERRTHVLKPCYLVLKPIYFTLKRSAMPRPTSTSGLVCDLIFRTSSGSSATSPIPTQDPAIACIMFFPCFSPNSESKAGLWWSWKYSRTYLEMRG